MTGVDDLPMTADDPAPDPGHGRRGGWPRWSSPAWSPWPSPRCGRRPGSPRRAWLRQVAAISRRSADPSSSWPTASRRSGTGCRTGRAPGETPRPLPDPGCCRRGAAAAGRWPARCVAPDGTIAAGRRRRAARRPARPARRHRAGGRRGAARLATGAGVWAARGPAGRATAWAAGDGGGPARRRAGGRATSRRSLLAQDVTSELPAGPPLAGAGRHRSTLAPGRGGGRLARAGGWPGRCAAAQAATARLAAGDLTARLPEPAGDDELSRLARSINQLAASLRALPGPGAAVPAVGLPRPAHPADLDPGLRRGPGRRDADDVGEGRGGHPARRPAASSAWSRDLLDLARLDARQFRLRGAGSTSPRWPPARWTPSGPTRRGPAWSCDVARTRSAGPVPGRRRRPPRPGGGQPGRERPQVRPPPHRGGGRRRRRRRLADGERRRPRHRRRATCPTCSSGSTWPSADPARREAGLRAWGWPSCGSWSAPTAATVGRVPGRAGGRYPHGRPPAPRAAAGAGRPCPPAAGGQHGQSSGNGATRAGARPPSHTR